MLQPQQAFRSFLCVMALGTAMLLASCQGMGPSAELPASVDRAQRLASQNNHAGAAQMYESLAQDNSAPARADFALAAVREWLAGNRAADAARVLNDLVPGNEALTPPQAFERQLLGVEIQIARGQATEAWRQLATIPVPRDPPGAQRYLQLQQRTAFAAGRLPDGVAAGVALERVATNDAQRAAVRRDLLRDLRTAIDRGARVDANTSRDPLVRGWLELGGIAAGAGRSPLGAADEIERWRARFPGHPGITVASAEILGNPAGQPNGAPIAAVGAGTQVALLLPLSGPNAVAGSVIRDGFMAAWYHLPEAARPVIRVYDTGELSVTDALARATQEGAQFIVGPLTRPEVQAAIDAGGGRRAPILALNFLPSDQAAPPGVYQFALSPEDEARQIARRAVAAGQLRAIVIAPAGDWGNRVVTAFREEFTVAGGSVIAQSNYDPSRNDYADSIVSVLRVNESRARHKRIEEIVGSKLEFEGRRRADVQMIFAASLQPLVARQLRPQLRFFYASDVPTYMTSDGFEPDQGANQDLDGMLFVDMPWMLQESGPAAEVRLVTQQAWGERAPRQPRYFAFGYDAHQLMMALRAGRSAAWPLEGVTGRLSLDDQRRVHRELDWAQIRNGQPRPLPAPGLAAR